MREHNQDPEDLGFVRQYKASGEFPHYIGATIDHFDELCDDGFVGVDPEQFTVSVQGHTRKIPIAPNREQIEEANEAMSQLPTDLQRLMPPIGVYLVWASS